MILGLILGLLIGFAGGVFGLVKFIEYCQSRGL